MTAHIRVFEAEPEALHVSYYNGEAGQGIAKDFYKNTLPKFARGLGYRFIRGSNDNTNIDFFLNKVGRYKYSDIKEDSRNVLFPNVKPDVPGYDWHTVQFLYTEDEEKYVIPDKRKQK